MVLWKPHPERWIFLSRFLVYRFRASGHALSKVLSGIFLKPWLGLVLLLAVGNCALADELGLVVSDAWIREGPPNIRMMAGYLRIENTAKQPAHSARRQQRRLQFGRGSHHHYRERCCPDATCARTGYRAGAKGRTETWRHAPDVDEPKQSAQGW